MKQNSWSKPENNNSNYIGRRKIVHGLFERGTAISNKCVDKFLGNLSEELKYSSGVQIKVIVDNKEFEARMDRPRSHSEESRYIRLFFKKELKDYLNDKIKAESNINELYLDFYVGNKKDTFKLEVVKVAGSDKFIFEKEVDKSTLTDKITIPKNVEEIIKDNLSSTLERSGSVPVKFIIGNKSFEANVKWPGIVTGRNVTQISYGKELKDYFSKEFEASYDILINKENKVPDDLKEYIEFYLGDKKDTFILKLIKSSVAEEEDEDESETEDPIEESEVITNYQVKESIDFIYNYIISQGYTYDKSLIKNIYLSLKTKPFLILSGISGTGKSKIIELFAKALGATAENKRFNLIPVKPDWSDSTDLLGYRNIEGQFVPGIITKVCKEAIDNKNKPYFIVLDEMNLARVEYYFSDILSLMETRRCEEGEIITNNLLNKDMLESTNNDAFSEYGDVYIPENVYIVGTVNMDETTFPFSRKVLDRANTIEFNKVDLSYDFDNSFSDTEEPRVLHNDFLKSRFLKIKDCVEEKDIAKKTIEHLIEINNILEKYNFHFAYRVRDEIVFYMIYAIEEELLNFNEAFDNCIVQKVLPKINGSSNECFEVLLDLFEYLNGVKISNRDSLDDKELNELEDNTKGASSPLATEKLLLMIRRFIKDGFTTFW